MVAVLGNRRSIGTLGRTLPPDRIAVGSEGLWINLRAPISCPPSLDIEVVRGPRLTVELGEVPTSGLEVLVPSFELYCCED